MYAFSLFKQSHEVAIEIALRAKKMRKKQKITQAQMAERAGLSLGSLQRFEQTGEISLNALLKIAHFLDVLQEFDNLFKEKEDINKRIEKLFE